MPVRGGRGRSPGAHSDVVLHPTSSHPPPQDTSASVRYSSFAGRGAQILAPHTSYQSLCPAKTHLPNVAHRTSAHLYIFTYHCKNTYVCACVRACMHRYACTPEERNQKYPSKYLFCKGLYKKKDEFKKKKNKGRQRNIFPCLRFSLFELAIIIKSGSAIFKTQHYA